jgi:hypothetical protein
MLDVEEERVGFEAQHLVDRIDPALHDRDLDAAVLELRENRVGGAAAALEEEQSRLARRL